MVRYPEDRTEQQETGKKKKDVSRGKNKMEPISTLRTYTFVIIEKTISLG